MASAMIDFSLYSSRLKKISRLSDHLGSFIYVNPGRGIASIQATSRSTCSGGSADCSLGFVTSCNTLVRASRMKSSSVARLAKAFVNRKTPNSLL